MVLASVSASTAKTISVNLGIALNSPSESGSAFEAVRENLDQFLSEFEAFLAVPPSDLSKPLNVEEENSAILLLTVLRDLLSLCTAEDGISFGGKFVCTMLLKRLSTSAFVKRVIGACERLNAFALDLTNGKAQQSSSERLESCMRKKLLLLESLFQYCNVCVDLAKDEIGLLVQFLSQEEQSAAESSLVLLGLAAYAEKSRIDLAPFCSGVSWKNSGVKEALLFVNSCNFADEKTCGENLEAALEYFCTQSSKFASAVYEERDEFAKFPFQTLKNLFIRFILSLSRLMRVIRAEQEENFLKVLRILSTIYLKSSNGALEFWERDGRLSSFLRWCSESSSARCISAFLNLLCAVSQGNLCAKHAFDMISAGHLGIISWEPFFDSLEKYVNALHSQSDQSFDIDPEEYVVLLSFLALVRTLCLELEECRQALFQPHILNSFISLLCCRVPLELKARILSALAAFATDSGKASIISSFLQKSQIIHGLLSEIQQVEIRQETWAETLSFLDLAINLSKVEASIGPLVLEKIFFQISRRSFASANEKLLVAGKCMQTFGTNLSKEIALRFTANVGGCSEVIFDLFSHSTCANFPFYAFYAVKFLVLLVKTEATFVDVLFSKNEKFLSIFELLSSNQGQRTSGNVSFFILELLQVLSEDESSSRKLSQLIGTANQAVIDGFAAILSEEGPAIELNSFPQSHSDDTDYSFLLKSKLLAIMCKQNAQESSFFPSFLHRATQITIALCDTIRNSAHSLLVEASLHVLQEAFSSVSASSDAFARFLRSDCKLIDFLLESCLPLASSPARCSRFTLTAFGFILRIVGNDLFSLHLASLSTSSTLAKISLSDVGKLIEVASSNVFVMQSFEFFLDILVNCLPEHSAHEMSIRETLASMLISLAESSESIQIVSCCCNCIFLIAKILVAGGAIKERAESLIHLLQQSSERLGIQSRIALYSALITLGSSGSAEQQQKFSLSSQCIQLLSADLFAGESTLCILAMGLMECAISPSILSALSRTTHLKKLISMLFDAKTDEFLALSIANFLSSFFLLPEECNAFDALVEAEFLDFFLSANAKLSNAKLLPLLCTLAAGCLQRVPSATQQYSSACHKAHGEYLKQKANSILEQQKPTPSSIATLESILAFFVALTSNAGDNSTFEAYEPIVNKFYIYYHTSPAGRHSLLSGVFSFYENRLFVGAV